MIHSIIPHELLEEQNPPQFEWICRDNRFFALLEQNGIKYISRIFSTDPNDYLNPEFAPGSKFDDKG